jgi:hypothetical protein
MNKMSLERMNEQVFWKLIEDSKTSINTLYERMLVIQNKLANLEIQHIFKFDKVLVTLLNKANKIDVWAAGCVLTTQCDKDSFECFRYWLIMQGQRIFKKALDDPEYLEIFIGDFKSNAIQIKDYAILSLIAERAYFTLTLEQNYKSVQPFDLSKDLLDGEMKYDNPSIEDILPVLCKGMGWENEIVEGNWASDE